MTFRILKPLTLAIGLSLAAGAGALESIHTRIDPKELDPAVGACANLNDHVNGLWAKSAQIPADRTTWGSFEMLAERSLTATREIAEEAAKKAATVKPGSLEQKIGDFYKSGMDTAAIEKAGLTPIADDLRKIDALKTPEQIAAYLREQHAAGVGPLFNFGAQADFKNSSKNIAYAFQGGLGLPERAYYLEDGKDGSYKKIREAYVAHIGKMLELAGTPADKAAAHARQILAFETRLATASLAPVELRDPANQYHFVALDEADKLTPHFAWTPFFAAQGIRDANGFSLSQPKFFAEVDKMLAEVPAAEWQAYLRFHTVDEAAPYLADRFAQENFAFYGQTLRGQKEMKPRWKRVLGTLENGMGMALGQIYVEKYFPPEAKQRAQELVGNLRQALKVRLENLDWMSPETKKLALEKWSTFMPKIGYPDEWRDWSGLAVQGDGYFANVMAAARFNHAWDMGKVGKPVDRKEWGMTPQTVNAYYNPLLNEIVFPAAILQPPFFDAKADDALNYGGIGAVIGHEMFHGYDDEGSQFDAQGNLKNWWTEADRKQFEARAEKLVKQFDDYVAIDDLHVKGQLTLGENIADLGGVSVSFDALKLALAKNPAEATKKIDGYTPEQRFFLNFAQVWRRSFRPEELKLRLNTDPHAPAMFRAIGAPSNIDAFAQAFACKAGDPMVRSSETRVKIW